MVDIVDKATRSRMMSGIKGKNTQPERAVRSFLHKQGLRFHIHRKDLSGEPDIVLPKYRTVVFVNGCYWHRHEGCKLAYMPKSNIDKWQKKFDGNVERDRVNYKQLEEEGWRVIVVWECEVRDDSYQKWIVDRIKNNV